LDISLGRLLVARQLIPEGDYIQGSAVRLPVRAGAFPVIIAFGAIHHLPDQAACFRECHRALAPKGLLGFHEPIRKPLLFPSATGIRQLMATYEHSEHDREIHVEETIALLQSLGMRIHSARYFVSPLRTVIASILNRSPRLMRVRWIARATDIADGIFLFTLGRLRRSLGPHALALVASKSQIPAEH
jgi:SAM-dependent methyltransferase